MIRRKLLIATAIIASVGIAACSDMTAPSKLAPGGFAAASLIAPHAGPVTVVARINGGGTAEMSLLPILPAGQGGSGKTMFGTGVTLFSDGSATGHFDCVDQHGDPSGAGNIFGAVTSWSWEGTTIVLQVTGKLTGPGGHPVDISFTVKIQTFGGPGVGHWTLGQYTPAGVAIYIFCNETMTSGQIVYKPE
jgi:hypothetical protein